jgi:hypothetical protein
MAQSPAYAVAAITLSRASCRTTGCPTAVRLPGVRLDGVDDLRVSGAAAEIALEGVADLVAGGARIALEEGQRGQQHPGRAKPALHGAVPEKRFLERMEPAVVLQSAHGDDGTLTHGAREHEAARHGPAVEQHRAGAAHPFTAAFLDVEDAERVAQDLEERQAGRRVDVPRTAVDDELHQGGPSLTGPSPGSSRG